MRQRVQQGISALLTGVNRRGIGVAILVVVAVIVMMALGWIISPLLAPLTEQDAAIPGAPAAVTLRPVAMEWYFAEGISVPPYQTYYSIFNPAGEMATVYVELYLAPLTADIERKTVYVAPRTQTTVLANEILATKPYSSSVFSAKIWSATPMYVERLLRSERDGTTTVGLSPARQWYFPELKQGPDHETVVSVFNPTSATVEIGLAYFETKGGPIISPFDRQVHTLAALGRLTFPLPQFPGSQEGIGLKLMSSQPVVAEHTTLFNERKAIYGSPGATGLSKRWYLGSGNTMPGYVQHIAVLNPDYDLTATVTVSAYVDPRGKPVVRTYTIPPARRYEISLDPFAQNAHMAVMLEADQPVAAQSVAYYISSKGGATAAYSLPLMSTPARTWYLPGTVSDRENESNFVLFTNDQRGGLANVEITYILDQSAANSSPVVKTYRLAGQWWKNLRVSEEIKRRDEQVASQRAVAAVVRSSQPMFVDRTTMFQTMVGATASPGIAQSP